MGILDKAREEKRVPELIKGLFNYADGMKAGPDRMLVLSAACWLRTLHERGERNHDLDLSLFCRAEDMRRSAQSIRDNQNGSAWAISRLEMHASDMQALAECGYTLAPHTKGKDR